MWVFTEFGFFSIVAYRDKPETVLVRGRVKDDLREFAARAHVRRARVFGDETADYPFRLKLPKGAAAKVLLDAVVELDYDNFKNRVAQSRGHQRSGIYHGIWALLRNNLDDRSYTGETEPWKT